MKFKRRKVKRGRVEIIPMIDTVVILLIFYMTFSRFVEQTREASIQLPTSIAGDEIRVFTGQVVVNMHQSDRLSIDATDYTVKELSGFLRGFREKLKQTNPDVTMSVILRGNKDMTYQDLSAFMRACAKAQVVDVTFATLEATR
jgi:biopolymer transport protein ExbD